MGVWVGEGDVGCNVGAMVVGEIVGGAMGAPVGGEGGKTGCTGLLAGMTTLDTVGAVMAWAEVGRGSKTLKTG